MSHSSSSLATKTQALVDPKAHWITPEDQVIRFAFPHREDRLLGLIPDLIWVITEYVVEPRFTEWRTSLKRINQLPQKIPPLRASIYLDLNEPCPKEICAQKKPDGSSYTLIEKGSLTLVSKKLGTFDVFQAIITAYGKTHYSDKENPFRFNYFSYEIGSEPGSSGSSYGISSELEGFAPEATHWVFHTDDLLENSTNKSYLEQSLAVASIATKSLDWKIPRLRDTIATIFLKNIATGKNLFPSKLCSDNYTRVQEKLGGHARILIGNFESAGLDIGIGHDDRAFPYPGVAASCRL